MTTDDLYREAYRQAMELTVAERHQLAAALRASLSDPGSESVLKDREASPPLGEPRRPSSDTPR